MKGQIQIYVHGCSWRRKLRDLQKADLGDFLGEGKSCAQVAGELSIKSNSYHSFVKSPSSFAWLHGLSDVETIYRKRYLDLISNRRKLRTLCNPFKNYL